MTKFGNFPQVRMRRNRKSDWSRRLLAESTLSISDLVYPMFIQDGNNKADDIKSMPGVQRLSTDLAIKKIEHAEKLGIPAVALFPVINPSLKSENGEESYNPDNLICKTINSIKDKGLNIGIICDVALDPYTSHGHDGVIKNGDVENDKTIDILCKQAINQANAGCDIVAPSDMMDGRIGQIRNALDSEGHTNTQILSYAAKYASSFYGPFRDAVGSSINLGKGDKKTYQMNPCNSDEAIKEVALDIQEGADMVIIKPGMPYLDIIGKIKANCNIPIFAYQVSGEYAMIKAAAQNDWLDEDCAMMESMIAFKRAGASGIFTYMAIDLAEKLEA